MDSIRADPRTALALPVRPSHSMGVDICSETDRTASHRSANSNVMTSEFGRKKRSVLRTDNRKQHHDMAHITFAICSPKLNSCICPCRNGRMRKYEYVRGLTSHSTNNRIKEFNLRDQITVARGRSQSRKILTGVTAMVNPRVQRWALGV